MVITTEYFGMAQVALRSLRLNSGFNIPCYIFCTDQNDHQAIDDRVDELYVLYNNLIIEKVDTGKYIQHDKGWAGYWSHEIFNIKGYERVIFSDADVICMGSLTDLPATDLGMVREVPRKQFFAGFMSIGQKYLNAETYEAILKHQKKPGTWGRDQAVYNEYFKENEITEFHKKYTIITNYKCDDMRMLHYIFKPGVTARLSQAYSDLWNAHAQAVDSELKNVNLFRQPCK
jgi:lipopolysaccharide biosynthesis glycosyltransferase